MTELAAALSALYARVPLGMRLGLDTMRASCTRHGHPERSFAVVHVGGTNGKGSTAAMVEAMARASGKRTGLYTSPHLCRFAERIRVGGAPITDEALTAVLRRVLVDPDLSFFEAATMAAFLAFRDAAVDLAVVEVGIGGRLDATNVIPSPRCTAITRIAFDHQDRLGDTLEAIAGEKAGIAKPGVPLVLGPIDPGPRAVIARIAGDVGAPIVDARAIPDDAELALAGAHQRYPNAAVAWTIADAVGIDEASRRVGLRDVRWPGRLERIERTASYGGPWLLDGAHNPDGAEALVRALRETPPKAIVFGALADKEWPAMLDQLAEVDAPRFYAAPRGRAPAEGEALAMRAKGTVCASIGDALAAARRAAGDGLAVVCGSLYLVGDARAILADLPQDPPVAL